MKLLFVRFADLNEASGQHILDNRLLDQLLVNGIEVEVENVRRRRSASFPVWTSSITSATLQRVAEARRSGRKIVLSHEGLFGIADHGPVDALIVHNYFTHFEFRGRPVLKHYFRFGSSAFYSRAFAAARCALFISHREYRLARIDFPSLKGRSDVCIPPPHPTPRTGRSDKVLHVSGTDDWRPKKLSRLTREDLRKLAVAGYRIGDFDVPVAPGFALINDRFEVGFKLKLAQMLYSRDVIASFSNLHEEIQNICPGNPFYRQVATVEEAIAFFQEIVETHGPDEIDAHYTRREAVGFLPDWQHFATHLIDLFARPD